MAIESVKIIKNQPEEEDDEGLFKPRSLSVKTSKTKKTMKKRMNALSSSGSGKTRENVTQGNIARIVCHSNTVVIDANSPPKASTPSKSKTKKKKTVKKVTIEREDFQKSTNISSLYACFGKSLIDYSKFSGDQYRSESESLSVSRSSSALVESDSLDENDTNSPSKLRRTAYSPVRYEIRSLKDDIMESVKNRELDDKQLTQRIESFMNKDGILIMNKINGISTSISLCTKHKKMVDIKTNIIDRIRKVFNNLVKK